MPDEAIAYAAVPLFAWWWVDTVLSCLELYRLGADQPSALDFVAPSIVFVLWVFAVMWAWQYLRQRIQK